VALRILNLIAASPSIEGDVAMRADAL
jgi:hypothetical protein